LGAVALEPAREPVAPGSLADEPAAWGVRRAMLPPAR
jgi:hypothetical protein